MDHHATPYPTRLGALEQLARRFPGFISFAGHEYRSLGLWAGVYLQTKWQLDSGRDRLPVWSLLNESVTMLPYRYFREYRANPGMTPKQSHYVATHSTRDAKHAPVTHLDTCRAWKSYFKAQDELQGSWRARFVLPKKFWLAHNLSMRQALWHHAPELDASNVPAEELGFWRGWTRLVLRASETLRPATTDLLLMPLLKLFMPPESPLCESCPISDEPTLRRMFLKAIKA